MLFIALAHAAPLLADLDQDGLPESITASFDDASHLQVQVREDGHTRTLDLDAFVDIMGPRTRVELSLVPVEETGVPLLMVHVPRGEYCGSGNDWVYVSYTNDTPLKALQTSDWSDAPVWSTTETNFVPKRRTVRVVSSYGEEDRVRSRDSKKLRFVDGIYQ